MKSNIKKWLTRLVITLILLFVLAILVIAEWSPQNSEPFRNESGEVVENSISSIDNIEINGLSQRVVIRGLSIDNPVLLHLHGGPGAPDRPAIRLTNAHLEDIFIVVYWDQRGTGGSYNKTLDYNSISLPQIADDGIILAEYLAEQFNKEKIYLQGHSWGSAVGVTMANIRPDLFHAYIGIGQMAYSEKSEIDSYNFTLDAAQKSGNQKDVDRLIQIGKPPYPTENWINNMMIERQILWKYENPLRERSQKIIDIYMMYIRHPEYSIKDKLGVLKGSDISMQYLWDDAMNINFIETIPELQVPVFIIQGKYDRHTSTSVAKEYFDSLVAPEKHFFEFDKSAHAPHFEEFGKYHSIVKEYVLD